MNTKKKEEEKSNHQLEIIELGRHSLQRIRIYFNFHHSVSLSLYLSFRVCTTAKCVGCTQNFEINPTKYTQIQPTIGYNALDGARE